MTATPYLKWPLDITFIAVLHFDGLSEPVIGVSPRFVSALVESVSRLKGHAESNHRRPIAGLRRATKKIYTTFRPVFALGK